MSRCAANRCQSLFGINGHFSWRYDSCKHTCQKVAKETLDALNLFVSVEWCSDINCGLTPIFITTKAFVMRIVVVERKILSSWCRFLYYEISSASHSGVSYYSKCWSLSQSRRQLPFSVLAATARNELGRTGEMQGPYFSVMECYGWRISRGLRWKLSSEQIHLISLRTEERYYEGFCVQRCRCSGRVV